eukprot:scaffold11025_cov41-Phaeocystis_antarctica.AAC.4
MYWSQTESSKWSLDSLSHDLGHPFMCTNTRPAGHASELSNLAPRLRPARRRGRTVEPADARTYV